jgi:dTDP-4-amino-4,6-dideoxygalactose transaminase
MEEGPAARRVPLLDLARQWAGLEEEVLAEVRAVFRESDFILGKRVAALEGELAAYCGAPRAVACASGTDAILLGLKALGIGPGDEVVTTPFTFFATAGAVANCGARPVFADIDPATFGLSPAAAEAALTPRTRAILPVHLFGRAADMTGLLAVAARAGIPVVEDMAQAVGAEHRGRRCGSLGELGTLSFYPSKNLGGAGDGGMVVTRDPGVEAWIRRARNHGQSRRYEHEFVGTNSRLDGLQAAVLRAKLRRLDGWTAARAERARRYDALLAGVPGVRTPDPDPEGRHVWNQYTIRSDRRDALREHLAAAGVGTAVYYPVPLHLQRCFAHLGGREGQFPESERASREVLSLPVFPELTEAEQGHVADRIREFHGKG